MGIELDSTRVVSQRARPVADGVIGLRALDVRIGVARVALDSVIGPCEGARQRGHYSGRLAVCSHDALVNCPAGHIAARARGTCSLGDSLSCNLKFERKYC